VKLANDALLQHQLMVSPLQLASVLIEFPVSFMNDFPNRSERNETECFSDELRRPPLVTPDKSLIGVDELVERVDQHVVKEVEFPRSACLQGVRNKECADGTMARERGSTIQTMTKAKGISGEARALERVVSAAREVKAASLRLEAHYARDSNGPPTTLEMARFAAAMQELKDAREAFDALVAKRDACST
jgi:hypothetical protein